MIILTADELRRALPITAAIDAVEQGFLALATGNVAQPLRVAVGGVGGTMLAMPAWVAGMGLGLKVVTIFPGNEARGLATINGAVLLADEENGLPLALIEGRTLTAIRTGAASGVATRAMARPDSRVLAIFGAGAQAPWQVAAVCATRSIERVLVVNRSRERGERLAALLRGWGDPVPGDAQISTAEQALAQADVICCATSAVEPLFDDSAVRPGTHINAVGSFTPQMREIPSATVARARVVVDQREAAWAEAGDLMIARDEGAIDEEHIAAELGELVAGIAPGRTGDDQITLFKSVGLGLQDVAAACAAYERARRAGIGVEIEW